MSPQARRFVVTSSPLMKRAVDTPAIMRHVLYSLVPVVAAATWFFGVGVLLILLACSAGACGAEWLLGGRGSLSDSPLADASALLTGVLLALTLPPGLPLWMAVLGGFVAVAVGKVLFGGLGQNVFNPALVGRAFLQASFPEALTTWDAPRAVGEGLFRLRGDLFALPFTQPHYDAVTAATPLAMRKFEATVTATGDLVFGNIAGSAGETCAVLILLGGAYLAWRRFLDWRIPLGVMLSVGALAGVLHAINPETYAGAQFHLFSGGLMLGAVYMATDPVSSPVTPRGAWLFAAGIGVLVILIRQFSGLPEGVMYSILLMNGLVPLIERFTQPRIYGARSRAEEG